MGYRANVPDIDILLERPVAEPPIEARPGSANPAARIGLVVGIATSGRSAALQSLLRSLARQTRRPDLIVVCADAEDPVPTVADQGGGEVLVVRGPRHLCVKRNCILRECAGFDIVTFFDDDFVPDDAYLEGVEAGFKADASLVALTGKVLADGVNGSEIGEVETEALLRDHRDTRGTSAGSQAVYNAYGCNMSFRLDAIGKAGLQFDERLPLYGWLEDLDFCRRLAPYGGIERHDGLAGVHRGVKGARLSGRQFGYSQVANSLYLVRKGSHALAPALNQIARNVVKNALLSVRPEPWCDRRGRLAGNLLALQDLVRGRMDVARILSL